MQRAVEKLDFQKKILLLFCLGFILLGFFFSIAYQYGNFWRSILGQYKGLVFDPGGWYLPSGAYFFRSRTTHFFGHPGLVLQLIIGVLLETCYFLVNLWKVVPYEYFVVKNYPVIISSLSMMMTVVQVLAFYLIYKISQKVFNNSTYSMIAVIAYGTTIPVYYYINKISPDVICTFLILFSIYMLVLGTGVDATAKSATKYIIIAGFSITTSIFSKAVYGLPVIIAAGIYLLFVNYPIVIKNIITRKRIIAIFVLPSIVTAAIWSYKIDYPYFMDFWTTTANSRISPDFWRSLELLSDHPNNIDIFLLGEFVFLLISLFGVYHMVFSSFQENKHNNYLFSLIFLVSIPMAVIKLGAPHYLFITCATGSIAFSFQIKRLFSENLLPSISDKQKSLIGLLIILVIHFASIYMVTTSHIQSIHSFRQSSRPVFAALQNINYDEKIAVNEETQSFRKYFLAITKVSPQGIKDAVDHYFIYSETIDGIPKEQGVKYFIDIRGTQTTSISIE